MASKTLTIRFSDAMLARIDAAADRLESEHRVSLPGPLDRSKIVRALVAIALDRLDGREVDSRAAP